MKRIYIIIFALLCTANVGAQSSQEILRQMSSAIKKLGSYSANFIMSSVEGENNGSFAVHNQLFCISAGVIELQYDGNAVYEIDHSAKEIIIDNLSDNYSFWSNPAQAFTMLDTNYEHELEGTESLNGQTLYRINLQDQLQSSESFTLWVDATTFLPNKAVYGVGEHSVSIRFVRIQPNSAPDANLFTFDKAKYLNYEHIDMRD